MSKWTHAICTDCWNKKNPDREAVHVVKIHSVERCCYCGQPTSAGIFVRDDPKNVNFCDHN